MNHNDTQFQDYLDGRLGTEERRAFELRLKSEPEMTQRLTEARRVQAALREEEPLPPGFYTRTREEFTRTHGKTKRRGFGWLSWEALGLAAAAGLALALFAPGMLRDELPQSEEIAAVRLEKSVDATVGEDELADADTSVLGDVVSELRAEPAPVGSMERQRTLRVSPQAVAEEKEEEVQPKSAPKPADVGRRDAGLAAEPRPVPSPPPVRRSPPREVQKLKKQAVTTDAATVTAPTTLDDALAETTERYEYAVAPEIALPGAGANIVRAEPLPVGTVPTNTVQTLPAASTWREFEDRKLRRRANSQTQENAEGSKAKTDKGLSVAQGFAEHDRATPNERTLWIGPRATPFSCVGVRVETRLNRHFIYLGQVGPRQPAAPGGCAVTLPADGKAFEVASPLRAPDE